MVDREARERIQALEAQGVQRDREIARLSGRLSRLAATLEAVHAGVRCPAAARPIDSPAIPPNLPIPKPAVPSVQAPAGFASLIVADFPAIFAEFSRKLFTLLWRDSRDGFGAKHFHRRCDGHVNTLTLIEDVKGNIFGGVTPVKWESPWTSKCKADPSRKSFLFTLKNPHSFPARKFALKAEKKDEGIYCDSSWGPYFVDVRVSDNCNANANSWTSLFGSSYVNDTDLDGSPSHHENKWRVYQMVPAPACHRLSEDQRNSRASDSVSLAISAAAQSGRKLCEGRRAPRER
jgi:hypothetical protein